MKTLVIYSRSSTQRPRSVLASLCDWLKKEGHEVWVLDITSYSFVNQDLPPRWFARLNGHDTFPKSFHKALSTIGVNYFVAPEKHITPVLLPPAVEAELQDAVWSDLVTYFRTDSLDTSKGVVKRVAQAMDKKARPVFGIVTDYLTEHGFDQVYVPNGRVPEQRMALEACKSKGVAIRYYEIGRAKPFSFYAGATQVHDRSGTQAEVDDVLAGVPHDLIQDMAHQWLSERTGSDSALNVYSTGWSTTSASTASREDEETTKKTLKAVFFSSSVDEFASYGKAWALHSWSDQYEGFDHIMQLLESQGVACTLRIHPNLTNKSSRYFAAEIARIKEVRARHPHLRVIWHNEPVNSYDLVRESDYIVVGRSTLGHEASLMGKCVWVTTAARYDLIADVRRAWGPEDVTPGNFELWKPDPTGAQRFAAYWAIQDHEFSWGESHWSTWDSFRAPQLLRLGQLFVKNTLGHKLRLIGQELTKIQNKRFSPQ